jgi:hypothetical protein
MLSSKNQELWRNLYGSLGSALTRFTHRKLTLLRFLVYPSSLRCLAGLLFPLFVCEFFGRRSTPLAAQLYRSGILLLGHGQSITAVSAGEPNGTGVPLAGQEVPVAKKTNDLDVCPALGIRFAPGVRVKLFGCVLPDAGAPPPTRARYDKVFGYSPAAF